MKLNTSRKAGFTLVEIMIVVAIIGLLAAIAIPNFVRARETAQSNACINNLRQIDGAKDQAALENGMGTGDDVSALIDDYIKGGTPACPLGDPYTVGNVGDDPTCLNANPATGAHILPNS
ncbi:MAG: type II secretion system GspH family protein [Verrucomicrobia bacterium]|jgi:prepilin-type N-terminal cleavage/methylation domain-containing protein|nr:type II secretion system GspH family protein [Verrucomicrobiota bacterium]